MDIFLLLPTCGCCVSILSFHSFQSIHLFYFILFNHIIFSFSFSVFSCVLEDESNVTPGDKKLHDHWVNSRVIPMLAKHVT